MVADPSISRGSLVSTESRTEIISRLSSLEGLRIPAHMQRQAQPPTQQQLEQHLAELLCRDPAVFLERYGSQLLAAELHAFTPLRNDFEVNYWCEQAEQQAATATATDSPGSTPNAPSASREAAPGKQTPARLPVTTKNRRLAYMNRLATSSDFFSEDNMRERAPLIWHDFIGQHEGGSDPSTAPLPAGRPGEAFHDQLLRNFDEAQLQARLAAGLQEEECQMSEQEESAEQEEEQEGPPREQEEQMPAQQQQQQQQQQELPHAAPANGTAAAMQGTPAGSAQVLQQPQQQQQQQQQLDPGLAPPAGIDEDMPDAAAEASTDGGGRSHKACEQQQGQQRQGQHQTQPPPQQQQEEGQQRTPPQQQAAQRRADFLDEMQARFLQGLDGGEVDYAAIDGDASLDDDWLEQVGQDAQEAYFDAD